MVVDVFGPAARGGNGVVIGGEARPADAEEVGGVVDWGFQGRAFGGVAVVDACCVGGEGREGDVVEARRRGVEALGFAAGESGLDGPDGFSG